MQRPLYANNPSCGTKRMGTLSYAPAHGYSTDGISLVPHYGRSNIGKWWDRVTPGETNYERAQRQIQEDKAQDAAITAGQKSIAKFEAPEIGIAPLIVTLIGIGGILYYAQRG